MGGITLSDVPVLTRQAQPKPQPTPTPVGQ
jgi:hypothetical protein